MNKPVILLVIGVMALIRAHTLRAQESDISAKKGSSTKTDEPIRYEAAAISNNETLEAAVRTTRSRLRDKGFSEREIVDAVTTASASLRERSRDNALTADAIANEVRKHGCLVVESEPKDAEVLINNRPDGKTRYERWVLSGAYRITIRKDGYVPAEGSENVPAERRVVFRRELQQKP